jgi:AhpD family alkylhydroperoxidase
MDGVKTGQTSWITRYLLNAIQKRAGRLVETWPILAHKPRILRGMSLMELHLGGGHVVDEKLRKLAELKVSLMVGCPTWIDIHSAGGREVGITEAQLLDISAYENSQAFTGEEKAVLDYARAMTRTPATVPIEVFEAVRAFLDERQTVELTAAIAQENFRARFNRPFDIQAAGFSEGAFCPVPERGP